MPDRVITITLTETGELNVNGPLTDKVLCFGLLEWAKDVVRDFHEKQVALPPTPAAEIRQ